MLRTPWCVHRIVPRSYDLGKAAAELLIERLSGARSEPKVLRLRADFASADNVIRLASIS
jgi:hypothetical protein